jgi:hypothetical protein
VPPPRGFACVLGIGLLYAGVAFAQGQQPPSRRCRTWDPSRIDPTYKKLANSTGGQVLALDPCKTDDSADVAISATVGRSLLSVNDRLSGEEKTYGFAVDPSMRRIAISATDVTALRLEQANGAVVVMGDAPPHVRHATTLNGDVYTVDDPEPGLWKVHVSAAGDFTLRVNAVGRRATAPDSKSSSNTDRSR